MEKAFVDAYLNMVRKDQKRIIKEDIDYDELEWTDDTHFEAQFKKTGDDYEQGHVYGSFSGEVITKEDGSVVIAWEGDAYSDAMDDHLEINLDGNINEGEVGCNGDDPKKVAEEIYSRYLDEIEAFDVTDYYG